MPPKRRTPLPPLGPENGTVSELRAEGLHGALPEENPQASRGAAGGCYFRAHFQIANSTSSM